MKVAQGEDWFTRWEERVGSEPAIPDAKPSLFIKASTFADQDVPPRQWLVNGLIPANTVTLLSGDGGAGKSLLALQLAMSVAIGHELPWLDRKIDKGTAFYVGAEDDLEEMQRRVNDVSMGNMIDMRTLEDLHLSSLTNRDALLSVVDNKTNIVHPSPLWHQLVSAIEAQKPKLVVLDTLADFYPGNENDRAQARQFIGQLRQVCVKQRTTIVLLSHPSLSGMATGTGTSGNTAWNNSVRSRLYMTRLKEDGYEPDKAVRKLTVMKSNYGETGAEIMMRWNDWKFDAEGEKVGLDKVAAEAKAERVFKSLLKQQKEVGIYLTHKTSSLYAPRVMSTLVDRDGVTKKEFARAMQSLITRKEVVIKEDGPASRRRSFLVLP
jgi:RecA-family ATPase